MKWRKKKQQADTPELICLIRSPRFTSKPRRRRMTCSGHSPFQKLHILRVLDEARPHHDGLETLAVDGPQLHVGESCKEEEIS